MARKPSAEAHSKVLEAAERLFAERGIDATSMDAISAESGVSKATIYKHWADKDKLALEVLSHLHGLDREPPIFDSGDLRADLISQLSHCPEESSTDLKERIMPHLIAYSARNQIFGRAWRELVMQRQNMRVGQLLQRGIVTGEFDENLDLNFGLAMIFGPLTYRHIFIDGKRGRAPKDYVERVVDTFFRAFGRHATHPLTSATEFPPPPRIKTKKHLTKRLHN